MSDHPHGEGGRALKNVDYKGHVIQEVPYSGTPGNYESYGLEVNKAYRVVDDFGDDTLPLLNNVFWTPADAAQAVDAALWLESRVDKAKATWPSTVTFEYNQMMAYRRRFYAVYQALSEIDDMCQSARDFDENPREAIIGRLQLLRLEVAR